LPGRIDTNNEDLMNALNETVADLEELVTGQSSSNILNQAQEVQFHVVIVCVFVCMFCVFILTKC
jgi:hypothetical protein